jgi:hypothetical protein
VTDVQLEQNRAFGGIIDVFLDRHFYFNAIHLETGVKIDFCVAGPAPIYVWAFEHRQVKSFDEFRQASYMPPESIILTKLRAYQEGHSTPHQDDIQGILRVSGPELDLIYVDRTAAGIGVLGIWRESLEKSGLRRRFAHLLREGEGDSET